MTTPPALELASVSRRFGATVAVDEVSLAFAPGQVHALVGENGAGKSTLGRIVAGVISPDSGEITLRGELVRFGGPAEALGRGVAMVAQELVLAPNLTVAENVLLGIEPRRLGWLDRRSLRAQFEDLRQECGLDIDGDVRVGTLSTAGQQKVEILRAVARRPQVVVLDEPTAALDAVDVAAFHRLVGALAARGCAIILVSHFLGEVLALAQDVTVMRDGRVVTTVAAATQTEATLVEAMLGRSLESTFPERPAAAGPVVLSVAGLRNAHVDDASLQVRAGEIVGVAGLAGSGRSELLRAICGADRADAGRVEVDGEARSIRCPQDAVDAGILTIHESRKEQGLFLGRPLVDNTSILSLDQVSASGWLRSRREAGEAAHWLDAVGVRYARVRQPVGDLSGGNQQKVLLSRALMHGLRVLLADEPTRGVDVGAKAAIYRSLRQLADDGAAVLFVSSEIEEILGLSDRVIVLRDGRIVAELTGDGITEQAVLAAAFTTIEKDAA